MASQFGRPLDVRYSASNTTTARRPPHVTAALNFIDVSKRFGAAHALERVNFRVDQGLSFGLAGVNGAGKTTLLKCMLDLCSASGGSIEIFGVPAIENRARARLTFLPERFSPPYYQNGRDFLRMMAGLRGDPYNDSLVRAIFERLDLAESALTRPVKDYSKGMTQKLGLASCLLADRDLIVLDEPMSGLDPKARAHVKELLADLKRRGRTVFFTSHALADIEETCDEMAVLDAGSLRFAGTPESLRTQTGAAGLETAFLRVIAAPGPHAS